MNINIDRRMQQLRQVSVARSALDVIAMIFLGCSLVFWLVAFVQLLAPSRLLSLLTLQAGVLAMVYALAAPLLLSALVPTTPAGQLLQKTQWRTFGFAAVVAAAVFLTYQGEWMIESWLISQPAIADAGMSRGLAISLSIAFVLIPALAWTQLTPERWLAQIQQAHQVRKLELQQNGEIAIIKARLLWAEQRAAMSYANLLPAEQKEIRDTLQGLLMGIADTQRGIARTLGIQAELERIYPTLDDREIADKMEYIASALEVPAKDIERSLVIADEAHTEPITPVDDSHHMSSTSAESERGESAGASRTHAAQDVRESRGAHQDATPVPHSSERERAGNEPSQRPAAPRSAPQRYAVEYGMAYQALRATPWTVAQLAEVLNMKERTARDRLNAWLDEGWAAASETKGLYYLTEGED
jgi:hypothetical protein